jgi:hypothetical protein
MTSLTRCAGGNSHRQNARAVADQPGRTLTVRHVSVGRKRSVLPGQLAPGDPGSGLSRSGQLGFSGCGSRARMDMRARLARCTWLSGKPSEHGLRISNYRFELGGAMGIRTPDLLHAIQWQHVHSSVSVQVTVSGRPHESPRNPGRLLYFRAVRSRPTAPRAQRTDLR